MRATEKGFQLVLGFERPINCTVSPEDEGGRG